MPEKNFDKLYENPHVTHSNRLTHKHRETCSKNFECNKMSQSKVFSPYYYIPNLT